MMSEQSDQIQDVIVIGAGLSGLSAATRLRSRSSDLKILVLEGSDRVGGRTESIGITGPKGEKDTLDLGGHWISTLQTYVLDLAKELNVEYYPQNIQGTKVMEVGDNKVRTYTSEIPSLGSWMALVDVQRLLTKIENLVKEINIRDPYAHPQAREMDDTTVAAYLKTLTNYKSIHDMLNAAFIACYGCDMSQISLLFALAYANAGGGLMNLFLVENGAAQEFRVKGGAQQFTVKMVEKFGKDNVLTGKAVTAIDKMEDGTGLVKCQDGTSFKAKKIICTTIASQTVKIQFSPPMPTGRQSLLKNFYIGNLMKFYVLYEESFWKEDGYSGEVVSSGGISMSRSCEYGPISIVYDATTKTGVPALVAFSGNFILMQIRKNLSKSFAYYRNAQNWVNFLTKYPKLMPILRRRF